MSWAKYSTSLSSVAKWTLAALGVAAALILKIALSLIFHIEVPVFILFLPPVVVSAYYFDLPSSLAASAFSLVAVDVWVFPPHGQFKIKDPSDLVSLAIFATFSVGTCLFMENHRQKMAQMITLENAESSRRAELEAALESMTDSVIIADRDLNFIDFNSASRRYFRLGESDKAPLSLTELRSLVQLQTAKGDEIPAGAGPISRAMLGESEEAATYTVRRRGTDEIWIGSYSYGPIRNQEGEVTGAVVVARDVSELARTREALNLSEMRYRTGFQTSLDAIALKRMSDGVYIDVNEAFCRTLGFAAEEIVGRTSGDIQIWVDAEDRKSFFEAVRQSRCREFQCRFRRKTGEIFWGMVSATSYEVEKETYVYMVVRDISKAKMAEEEIRTLAFFDPLTGLANRRLLLEQLRKSALISMRTHRKRALLLIDLDNFKSVNESQGYLSGDLLLREVAMRLNSCVREADTVGRVGGDEFAVVLEDLGDTSEHSATLASAIGEKILNNIDRTYLLSGREVAMTCSIGITIFGDDLDNVSDILRQAEIAARQAKEAGKNMLRFFAPSLQAAVDMRASLEEELRQGIRSNEFVLFYQPQFEDGRLCGAEALLRWNHPRMGILSPDEFIGLAEETRLIIPLGNLALETACHQLKIWSERPETSRLKVAVNISALQLRTSDFVDTVLEIIRRTGVNPRRLRLELTESMLVTNVEDAIAKMISLKSMGVSFSLDDFGTGYSSLAYLRKLPVDQLKIDRSFVSDILEDSSCAAIAQTIISLSRAMNLPVIAEGVETAEQLGFLERLGCHTHQGYFFSPPLPIESFERQIPLFTERNVSSVSC